MSAISWHSTTTQGTAECHTPLPACCHFPQVQNNTITITITATPEAPPASHSIAPAAGGQLQLIARTVQSTSQPCHELPGPLPVFEVCVSRYKE